MPERTGVREPVARPLPGLAAVRAGIVLLGALVMLDSAGARAETEGDCAPCEYEILTEPETNVVGSCCSCEPQHTLKLVTSCCDGDLTLEQEDPVVEEPCDPEAPSYTVSYPYKLYCEGDEFGSGEVDIPYERDCQDGGGGGCGGSCNAGGAGTDGSDGNTGGELPVHTFRLGASTEGKSTGFLRLAVETNEAGEVRAGMLRPVIQTTDADLVYDPQEPERLRQAMTAEGLVTVATNASAGYELRYYPTGSVAADLDAGGFYQLLPGAQPFASYSVTRSGTALEVTGGLGQTPVTTRYTPDTATRRWAIQRGSVVRAITLDDVGGQPREVRTLSAPGGSPLRTVTKTRAVVAGRQRLTSRIEGPAGAGLEKRWTYTPQGRLAREEHADGNWTRYARTPTGRVVATVTPLGDAGPDAPEALCRVVSNDYASVDGQDIGGAEWLLEPRTVAEYEAGVCVSRTYHAYYRTAGGEKVEIEERAATPTAAYGAAGNLRTKRTWFAKNPLEPSSEKLRSEERTGGLLETRSYAFGILDATAADPAAWTFTPDPTGRWVRATSVQATLEAPDGVAGLSRREVSVQDLLGRSLLDETHACVEGTNYARVSWVATTRDALGRATAVRRSDGTRTDTVWGCCGKESDTSAEGAVTEYAYDQDKRLVLSVRQGMAAGQWPAQEDVFTTNAYNAAGDLLATATFADGLSLTTSRAYDLLGRVTNSVDEAGLATVHVYDTSNRTDTVCLPGGAVRVTRSLRDGRTLAVTDNVGAPQYFRYGLDAAGHRWTLTSSDPAATNATFDPLVSNQPWSRTTLDFMGRTLAQERPAFGGGSLIASNAYDNAGRQVSTTVHSLQSGAPAVLSRTLRTFDELGNPLLTAQDLDLDGELDLAGPDRVQGQATRYWYGDAGLPSRSLGEGWWQETPAWTYPGDGSSVALTNAIARTRLTGLGGAWSADGASGVLAEEAVNIDARGNVTTARTVIDRANRTVYRLTYAPDSSIAALTVSVNGLTQLTRSTHGLETIHAHDALGRPLATQDARGAVNSRGYDAKGRVAWEADPKTNGTWYAYDNLGRRVAVTNALGQGTHTAYDLSGRIIAEWGATYPVAYEYDVHGRKIAMATTRDPDLAESNLLTVVPAGLSLTTYSLQPNPLLDITRWLYDQPTGMLTNKLYADGKGPAYTYTPDGRPASRTWARGVVTSYAYTNNSQLAAVEYSDATPDVAYAYNRLGRLYSSSTQRVNWRLRAAREERSSWRARNCSRTVRKKRSILPLAAPSRTGVCVSRQPRRAQI